MASTTVSSRNCLNSQAQKQMAKTRIPTPEPSRLSLDPRNTAKLFHRWQRRSGWIEDPIRRQLHQVIDKEPRQSVSPDRASPAPANRRRGPAEHGDQRGQHLRPRHRRRGSPFQVISDTHASRPTMAANVTGTPRRAKSRKEILIPSSRACWTTMMLDTLPRMIRPPPKLLASAST
jgi:hypothetical protein